MSSGIDELLEDLELLVERRRTRKLDFYKPYPKQMEFHVFGRTKRERLLRAGNQIGKTYAGAAEMAFHLTGEYPGPCEAFPEGWKGRRFAHPVRAWVAGEGAVLVRDGPQALLCGEPGVDADFGTGLIPLDSFADKPSLSRGVTDAYDTIQVYHKTKGVKDGISTLSFKSYDQGRKKFQTKTLDIGWCDEEPPADIYSEMLARITANPEAFLYITFTPLLGMSTVVAKFMTENNPDTSDTVMTLWDVPGMTQEQVDIKMRGYQPFERQSRIMGVPMMGSGRVFPIDDAAIAEPDIANIPDHWAKIWGIDFGINHPFAAVLIAWDRDEDVIHVLNAVRMVDALPLAHSAAMLPIAQNIPVAWPQDGTERRDDGKPLSDHYRRNGLLMLPDHATWVDGSISTEAGITEMYERMISNRFKVAKRLIDGPWGDEFRSYHRSADLKLAGKLVKVGDDLMSATRVAVMMKRSGKAIRILGGDRMTRVRREETRPFADNVDFDLFGG